MSNANNADRAAAIERATLIRGEGVFSLDVAGEWVDVTYLYGRLWLRADTFRVPPATTVADVEALLGQPCTAIRRMVRVEV